MGHGTSRHATRAPRTSRHARVPLAPRRRLRSLVVVTAHSVTLDRHPRRILWQCMSRAVGDASQAIPPFLALLSLPLSLSLVHNVHFIVYPPNCYPSNKAPSDLGVPHVGGNSFGVAILRGWFLRVPSPPRNWWVSPSI